MLRPVDRHRLAEETSIELHRAVAERLRAEPVLLDRARTRVRVWAADGSVHPSYVERWQRLLAGPLDEICRALVDPGEEARALRQVTPFAGVLDPRTRWRIWREVRRRQAEPA
jgi:hypothetical protein